MSTLREGIKHLLKEAVPPLPGFSILAQACDSGSSGVSHKEAAITQHVEDLKRSLDRLNAVDHTREVEFKGQLDRLMDDYRRSNTDTNRLSRLAKVTETLEALDSLSEQITRSIQSYTVDSISDHSEMLTSVDNDLKSAKADLEERMSKNEIQTSSILDMLKNLKGLLHQAAESLASLKSPSLAQFWTGSNSSEEAEEEIRYHPYLREHNEHFHSWRVAFSRCRRNGYARDPVDSFASYLPESVRGEHYWANGNNKYPLAGLSPLFPADYDRFTRYDKLNTPGQKSTHFPTHQGCTASRGFDISSIFSHQMSVIQVIAKCFRNMASSIRVDPDMPIHAWSHSCEPMIPT